MTNSSKMKKQYLNTIMITKYGNFYRVYGNDAIILGYLTDYKIVKNKDNLSVGFPISIVNKVVSILENNEISYYVHNDNEPLIYLSNNKNKYNNIFSKAQKNYEQNEYFNRIIEMLKEKSSVDRSILDKVYEILS